MRAGRRGLEAALGVALEAQLALPSPVGHELRHARHPNWRHRERVQTHRDRLAPDVPIELRPREHPRIPRGQVLIHPRRRRLPEPRPADVDVEEALLRVVAGAAAVEVADLVPELRELRAREGEVGGEALGVHGAARHLLPRVLQRLPPAASI